MVIIIESRYAVKELEARDPILANFYDPRPEQHSQLIGFKVTK